MKEEITRLLKKAGFNNEVALLIEVPKDSALGDYSLPCFALAKKFKKNPAEIAKEIASKIKNDGSFEKIEAISGYVNFFVDRKKSAADFLNKIEKEKDRYGSSIEGKGKKIVVEMSSPIIA